MVLHVPSRFNSLYKCIQMQNMEDMQNLDLEYFESEFEYEIIGTLFHFLGIFLACLLHCPELTEFKSLLAQPQFFLLSHRTALRPCKTHVQVH